MDSIITEACALCLLLFGIGVDGPGLLCTAGMGHDFFCLLAPQAVGGLHALPTHAAALCHRFASGVRGGRSDQCHGIAAGQSTLNSA